MYRCIFSPVPVYTQALPSLLMLYRVTNFLLLAVLASFLLLSVVTQSLSPSRAEGIWRFLLVRSKGATWLLLATEASFLLMFIAHIVWASCDHRFATKHLLSKPIPNWTWWLVLGSWEFVMKYVRTGVPILHAHMWKYTHIHVHIEIYRYTYIDTGAHASYDLSKIVTHDTEDRGHIGACGGPFHP